MRIRAAFFTVLFSSTWAATGITPGGMADADDLLLVDVLNHLVDQGALDLGSGPGAGRCRSRVGLVQDLHEHQPGDKVHLVLLDLLLPGGIVVVLGLGDEGYHGEGRAVLGGVGGILGHADHGGADAPDLLQVRQQLGVAVDLLLALRALHPHGLGAGEHHGVGAVHDGYLDGAAAGLDHVHRVARGSTLPVAAPAVPEKSIWMAAAVPGTPAISVSPVTLALPFSTGTMA